ncbi:MAG TPA: hypothetical protein VH476_01275 [Solirubrobacterales bacterium]
MKAQGDAGAQAYGGFESLGRSCPMSRFLSLAAVLAAVPLLIPASSSAQVLPAEDSASFLLGHGLNLLTTTATQASAISFKGRTITSYSTGARTKRTGVVASFGNLGRIDLDFEPSGPPSKRPVVSFCHGDKQLTWVGVFTGTVVLRGRYGFPSFRDRSFRKKGTLSHRPRWVCHLPTEFGPPPPRHGKGIRLWAGACDGRGFSVESERPRAARDGDKPHSITYSASASLRVGRVRVEQSITRSAAPQTFTFDEALTTATVGPPAPFNGNATLVRAADGSTTWSGTLSARMLGRKIALAGPAFQSGLESFPKSSGVFYVFSSKIDCSNG